MPPSPKVYIGVHSVPDGLSGTLISLGTQAALPGGWVLGPKYSATHAFVIVDDGGPTEYSWAWRLDGQAKSAMWTPCPLPRGTDWRAHLHDGALRVAVWWLTVDELATVRMIDHARSPKVTGAPYDWAEIAASAAAAFGALPGLTRLRQLGRADGFHSAMICTQVCRAVMSKATGPVADAARGLSDLFPERLAQALRAAEGPNGWTVRVV